MTEDELKAIKAHAKMRTERAWACVTCQDCGIDAEDVLALVAEVRRLRGRLAFHENVQTLRNLEFMGFSKEQIAEIIDG